MGRIKASIDDPLGLETAGHALFDMYAERRGNLFADEVYRLTKADDATTSYPRDDASSTAEENNTARYLPPSHKFGTNDCILLTLQPDGSGDFFSASTLPTSENAVSIEARVLNVGPTYVDVAVSPGVFVGAFGPPPNDKTANVPPNRNLRLRADRFFSNVPYERMVAALSAFTSLPERPAATSNSKNNKQQQQEKVAPEIHMDEVLRETILQTFAFSSHHNPLLRDPELCNIQDLVRRTKGSR